MNPPREIGERDESRRLSYLVIVGRCPRVAKLPRRSGVPLSQIIAARGITVTLASPYDLSYAGNLASPNMKSHVALGQTLRPFQKLSHRGARSTVAVGLPSSEEERKVHWGKLMRLSNYDRFV